MKKYRSLVLLIVFVLAVLMLYGCGSKSTPAGAADGFLSGFKEQDEEKIKKYYAEEDFEMVNFADRLKKSGNDSFSISDELAEKIEEDIFSFDYEISDEKIDGDKATVKVKVTTYDLGGSLKTWVQDYMTWAMKEAMSGASQDELQEKGMDMLSDSIDGAKKDYTKEFTMDLEKKDDEWKVSSLAGNTKAADALTGGMYSMAEDMSSLGE